MENWLYRWCVLGVLLVGSLGANPSVVSAQQTEKELPEWMKKRLKKEPEAVAKPVGSSQPAKPAIQSTTPYGSYVQEKEAVEPEEAESGIRAFALGSLIGGRGVKPSAEAHRFRVGIHSRVAPVRAVTKSQLNSYKEQYPEMDEVLELSQQVDLQAIEAASGEEIRAAFLSIDGLSESERAAVEDFDFESQREAVSTLIEVVSDPEEAVTFTLEPYLNFNTDLFGATLYFPLAGFSHGGDATFEMGNFALDTRFAHYAAAPGLIVAFSYGNVLSTPTGTSRADALALSNLFDSPRYRHAYLTTEPFVALGFDARFLLIQLDAGFTFMNRVRTEDSPSSIQYFRYGGALSLVPFDVVAFTVELTGGKGIESAQGFDLLQLTGAIRFRVVDTIEPVLGVQAPLALPGQESYGGTGDLAFGSPADINAFAGISFAF